MFPIRRETSLLATIVGILFLHQRCALRVVDSFQLSIPSATARYPVIRNAACTNNLHVHRTASQVPVRGLSCSSESRRRNTALGAVPTTYASSLFSSSIVAGGSALLKVWKQVVWVVVACTVTYLSRSRNLLWPGAVADPSIKEPLPIGSYGCPMIGTNIMKGTSAYGPFASIGKLFEKYQRPKLFKFYAFGRPFISVTGKEAIQSILKKEFGGGVSTMEVSGFPNYIDLLASAKNVLYENDKQKHAMMRKLVSVAMTPAALTKAVPAMEQAAKLRVEKITTTSPTNTVVMGDIVHEFTLDVAWRQILGFDFQTEEEINEFHKNVNVWFEGMMSPLFFMPFKVPFLKYTKTSRAKDYLVSKVEEKLAQLDANGGPDDSTISTIYFASDENGNRLSREEVIANALLLIIAGSETSSNTLINTILLMGLHKESRKKLQEEEKKFRDNNNGMELTKDRIDGEFPYLDAFIRETMRILPIPGLELRTTDKSMVIDGQQIPKNWSMIINTRGTHERDPSCYLDTMNHADSNGDDKTSLLEHMDIIRGFKPERWLSPDTIPQQWIPFGEGSRRCLGERLAMIEMKIFIIHFIRNVQDFELVNVSQPEDIKFKKMSVLPRPEDGCVISIKK